MHITLGVGIVILVVALVLMWLAWKMLKGFIKFVIIGALVVGAFLVVSGVIHP
jgi:hypothetical protein